METSRLKSIIIFILVLVNAFLLISLAGRSTSEYAADAQIQEELQKLFSEGGIDLTASIPSTNPPAALSFSRSSSAEQVMVADLLGSQITDFSETGGINSYETEAGQALFRSNGTFSVTGKLSNGDPEAFCRSFCKTYGYRNLTVPFGDASSGSAQAELYFNDLPVRGCQVTFLVEDGQVIGISGIYLPDVTPSVETPVSMSAATALSKFLQSCRESGTVVSSVSEVSLCYELESTVSTSLTLQPLWRVSTDTVDYYVNCSTGGISHD